MLGCQFEGLELVVESDVDIDWNILYNGIKCLLEYK